MSNPHIQQRSSRPGASAVLFGLGATLLVMAAALAVAYWVWPTPVTTGCQTEGTSYGECLMLTRQAKLLPALVFMGAVTFGAGGIAAVVSGAIAKSMRGH